DVERSDGAAPWPPVAPDPPGGCEAFEESRRLRSRWVRRSEGERARGVKGLRGESRLRGEWPGAVGRRRAEQRVETNPSRFVLPSCPRCKRNFLTSSLQRSPCREARRVLLSRASESNAAATAQPTSKSLV